MSFNKSTTFNINKDDIEVLKGELEVKTASFKIPDGFTYDSDYLYLKVKAVSAGEYWGDNKNNDYFPELELKENYKSFLVAHTFKNHENKKIENAIGDVLAAEWSERMKCVYLVIRIDKRIAPSVVRGFEKGFMTDVSMGCRVDHVVCSYCGQKAKTRFDYCDHLKTMKGKVMDNGKKVYEINIKPKFHDISAVLNGAERTAKVEGIYINNSKIAFVKNQNSLEKVASFNLEKSLSEDIFGREEELNMEVIATSLKEDKKEVDVKKSKNEITDKIVKKSCSDICKESYKLFDEISDSIKYNFTKYWDRNTCLSFGKILRGMSEKSSVRPEQVFLTFLKILDAVAIELSPLELHDIFFELFNFESHDLRKIKSKKNISDISLTNNFTNSVGINDLGGAIKAVTSIKRLSDEGDISLGSMGIPKIKAVIVKSSTTPITTNNGIITDIFEKIISGQLESRSNLREHLIPRLIKIAEEETKSQDNSAHFIPIKLSKLSKVAHEQIKIDSDIASALYSAYQNDRVNSYINGELEENMSKIALFIDNSFLEKTAKRTINRRQAFKASLLGLPLAMGYSGIQRARINNGEDVSSINRFVGENPSTAGMLAIIGTKSATNAINKNSKKIKYFVEDAGDFLKGIHKKSSDMFSSDFISDEMNRRGYSDTDIQIIKYASVLNKAGSEAEGDILLCKNKLSEKDIDVFLKVANDYYRIEIEKNASNLLKSVGASVASDALFDNVKKGSQLAMLPGYVADGLIFAGIQKGLKKISNKSNKEGSINE